jgi:hypothetical protein
MATYQLSESGATVDALLDLIGNDALTTTAQTLTGAINELDTDKMPKSGGDFTGAISVNSSAVVTASDLAVQEIELTANATNVNSIGASTRAYRIGRMVFATLYTQIKADVAADAELISGLPAPLGNTSVFFPAVVNSGNYAYRMKVDTNGVIRPVNAVASSQAWYVACFSYISAT